MRILKQSTAYNLVVFMTDAADHVAGKTGLSLTITASKDGGSFASITPTVTELSNGWYKLALTTSHTDTIGDLALHITATGADPTDLAMVVRANVLGDTLPANATQIAGDSTAATNLKGSATAIYVGSVTGSPTTTSFVDSALTQSGTDHWKGRVVIFTSGSLKYQATDITGFNPSTDTLSFTTLSAAPSTSDTYVIV